MSEVIRTIQELRSTVEKACDLIDTLKVETRHRSKQKAELSKGKIRAAVEEFLEIQGKKEFTQESKNRALDLLQEVSQGKHQVLVFQRVEGGKVIEGLTGIVLEAK